MKATLKYILIKKSIYKKIVSCNFDNSLNVPKKQDKERIGTIRFYDQKIIERVVKKSIDNHFKKLLELLASIDESDADPSEGLMFCLDEVAKFKRELINKYNKFMKKEKVELINKKIELIEKEIKDKLLACRLVHSRKVKSIEDEEIVEEKRRSR